MKRSASQANRKGARLQFTVIGGGMMQERIRMLDFREIKFTMRVVECGKRKSNA